MWNILPLFVKISYYPKICARYFTSLIMPYSGKIRLTLYPLTDTIQVQPYNFNNHFKCKGDFTMMYMHYCKRCHRVYMLNGHKQTCPKCRENITELKITYMEYAVMNLDAREQFCTCCADEEQLQKLSTTYRMFKYSKWYKELQTPISNDRYYYLLHDSQEPDGERRVYDLSVI